MKKTIKAWAGIQTNTISEWKGKQWGYADEPPMPAVFKSKTDACYRFKMVVPCTITYTVPAKKKRV